jgi:hypothetical protein
LCPLPRFLAAGPALLDSRIQVEDWGLIVLIFDPFALLRLLLWVFYPAPAWAHNGCIQPSE